MKKLLLFFMLAIACTMHVVAQDKATDLKKLIELMDSEKMIDGMIGNMAPMLKQQAAGKVQGSKADEFSDFLMAELKKLTNKLVNEEIVTIYDQHFTHEEIKDLIKFYESSTGKKMIEKTPEISMDLMNSMMKYMPEFQEALTKKMEELSK